MAPKRSHARESTPSASTRSHSGTSTPSRNTPAGGTSSGISAGATTATTKVTAETAAAAVSSSSSGKGGAKSAAAAGNLSPQEVVRRVWDQYWDTTPQRTKLIDVFMAFLVVVGVLQFGYCVLVGNYPFNAFLSGFSATVGQFVLTASLRIQTNPQNKADFNQISQERAFADYVFGSLILHFFCVNFIN